jgi:ABC-type cobalamin/Fe3+-siderophores transport system ATPase subunit
LVTGRPLFGPGDNATLLHHATVDYRGGPRMRLQRRRWERLARRHAALTVPPIVAIAGHWPLVAYESALVGAAGAYAVIRARRLLADRGTNKRYIDPAARTLYAAVGARYDKRRARQDVAVPDDWAPGDPVVVTLPTDMPLTAAKERALVRAVGGRLGIVNAKGSWKRDQVRIRVDIQGTALPPTEVDMTRLMEAVAAAPLTQPIIGMGPDGPVSLDYVQDSPHVALSGPAGTGKSTLLRFLMAQRMSHGVGVIFLDAKRWSHRWAHDLPADRCQYWYRIADIHNSLVAIGEELGRRIECDPSELGTFRTLDVVVEEANTLIKMLGTYWRGERRRIISEAKALKEADMDYDEADLDPPALSPAVAAMQFGVNMGRELQVHFHVAAQRLEANIFGSNSGAAVRQSFQIRLMAQWDMALWKMLAGGHEYVAWPGGKRGLWGFVQGTEFVIVRVPDLDIEQSVQLATSGQDTYGAILGQDTRVSRPVIESGLPLSTILDMLPGQDTPDRLSLEGLRTAAKRPGFPAPVDTDGRAYLYLASDVQAWRERTLS